MENIEQKISRRCFTNRVVTCNAPFITEIEGVIFGLILRRGGTAELGGGALVRGLPGGCIRREAPGTTFNAGAKVTYRTEE